MFPFFLKQRRGWIYSKYFPCKEHGVPRLVCAKLLAVRMKNWGQLLSLGMRKGFERTI